MLEDFVVLLVIGFICHDPLLVRLEGDRAEDKGDGDLLSYVSVLSIRFKCLKMYDSLRL